MRRAVRKHLQAVFALLALVVLATATGAYILSEQRFRFPLVTEKPFVLKIEMSDARAVQAGQGQTVRTAGVELGEIAKVELEEGRALVEVALEPRYAGFVREDATALLRSKTGLKDMFIEVDPGDGRPLPEGGRIAARNTLPDVDPDEILAALDHDTRDYLRLLITGAGKGLAGRGSDLREALARFGPLHRDLARVGQAVARRRRSLRRLVHNYGLLTTELGRKDRELTRLVRSSNAALGAMASEDLNISRFVARLPGTLRTTEEALVDVEALGRKLGPALEDLRPPFRRLSEANRRLLPFLRESTPVLRRHIRPFARASQRFTRDLGEAADDLGKAGPDLTRSARHLNRFFNIGAWNPGGNEPLSGDIRRDRAREESYLYWLAWTAQNGVSLFNTADGQGPFRRFTMCTIGDPASVLAPLAGNVAPSVLLELVPVLPEFLTPCPQ